MRVKDAVGRFGEQLAAERLTADGLLVLARNWRCPDGELDIVAAEDDVLVFVEVKTRSTLSYGDPAEAVNRAKAGRHPPAGDALAVRAPTGSGRELRFDVVSGCVRPSGADWSSTCAGRSDGARAHAGRRTDRGAGPARSRSRPTCRTGSRACTLNGLADTSVVESRDRIRAATAERGRRVAEAADHGRAAARRPAQVGSRFDLAVAVAVLACTGQVRPAAVVDASRGSPNSGLDGRLRPVRGVLPVGRGAATRGGVRRVVVAASERCRGGARARTWTCAWPHDLREVIDWLQRRRAGAVAGRGRRPRRTTRRAGPDLADVAGQALAKRAIEVAAAGGHHVFLLGAPGAGKTMLAERLPGLLPPLDDAAALEVSAVHSVAGTARRAGPADPPGAAAGAAPHRVGRVAGRRRVAPGPARRDLPRPSRGAVPGRGRRSSRRGRSTRCASRSRAAGRAAPRRRRSRLSGAVPARAGGEPLPVRAPRRASARAPPQCGGATSNGCPGPLLDRIDVRVAGRPGAARRAVRPGRAARDERRGRRPGGRGARRGGATLARDAMAAQREVPGAALRARPWRCRATAGPARELSACAAS